METFPTVDETSRKKHMLVVYIHLQAATLTVRRRSNAARYGEVIDRSQEKAAGCGRSLICPRAHIFETLRGSYI